MLNSSLNSGRHNQPAGRSKRFVARLTGDAVWFAMYTFWQISRPICNQRADAVRPCSDWPSAGQV
jgi:hypothetical protein